MDKKHHYFQNDCAISPKFSRVVKTPIRHFCDRTISYSVALLLYLAVTSCQLGTLRGRELPKCYPNSENQLLKTTHRLRNCVLGYGRAIAAAGTIR